MKCIFFFILQAMPWIFSWKVYGQEQANLVDGISSRLVLENSENQTIADSAFGFGFYREVLSHRTGENYSPTGLGVLLAFEQHIVGMWSGSLEARWSDWLVQNPTLSNLSNTSPLSLFSLVEPAPAFEWLQFGSLGNLQIKPFAHGGVGYTAFFDTRAWMAARSKTAFGQVSVDYGAGLVFHVPRSFDVKLGVDNWRGVQTADYFSTVYYFEILYGDVDHL